MSSAVNEGSPMTLGSLVDGLGWTVCFFHHRDQRSELILMVGKELIRPLSARAVNCIFFVLGSPDVMSCASEPKTDPRLSFTLGVDSRASRLLSRCHELIGPHPLPQEKLRTWGQ